MKELSVGILFLFREPVSSFVRNDIKLLERHFRVYCVRLSFNFFETVCGVLQSLVKADIIFVWFAGFQAFVSVFLAKVFRKKLVVVAGGYDAAYVPEINYGVFTCWWRAIMAIFVYRNADLVLPVSKHTKEELLRRVVPKKIRVVYNGIDIERFRPFGRKDMFVLTVGAISKSNLKKKGLKTFVETAKFLPKVRFVLVGRFVDNSIKYLRKIASKNVEFTGYVPFEKLLDFYRRAKVYAQLSYHESFGVALAEAMACGCVPVVTRKAAIPEVAGECGIYVPYGNAKASAKAIQKTFTLKELEKCSRDRIVKIFPLENRKESLKKAIISCLREEKPQS
jgi:glycosyltransferase involved in cell wall biosynthesis